MPVRRTVHRQPPRPHLYSVERPLRSSLRCVRVHERKLGVPWHYHPEYQLTLLLTGDGQRVVGDSIAPVTDGDLTLLGPNLPHFWDVDMPSDHPRHGPRSTARRRVDAVIVQFDPAVLGKAFWCLPETDGIAKLLHASDRGLVFSPAVRQRVVADILGLLRQPALSRLLAFVDVLHRLAKDRKAKPICSPSYGPLHEKEERDQLAGVIRRIQHHVQEAGPPPGRAELARLAGVSERTLSRFFRRRMNRTLPQFMNELRVGRARRLLLETSLTVTAIAHRCGFRNLSNFNAQFRRIVGRSPADFRRAFHGTIDLPAAESLRP